MGSGSPLRRVALLAVMVSAAGSMVRVPGT